VIIVSPEQLKMREREENWEERERLPGSFLSQPSPVDWRSGVILNFLSTAPKHHA
jgi:hypothetical protein